MVIGSVVVASTVLSLKIDTAASFSLLRVRAARVYLGFIPVLVDYYNTSLFRQN